MITKEKPKVAISVGDINGIGIEIILKTLAKKETLEFFTPIIFGSVKLLNYHNKNLGLDKLFFNGIPSADKAIDNKINVVNLWKELPEINIGSNTSIGGQFAWESLQAATKSVTDGVADVLVTAPINKQNIQSASFNFPGHTEYLADAWGGKALMFMVSNDLKVGLVTQHIPLEKVASAISKEAIQEKIKTIQHTLKQDFRINQPKIAVLGLNPHAGDNQLLGSEDDNMIKPAVKELFDAGIYCFGPYSADSFFTPNNMQNFDAILAMYHDQGLIPFKTISFGNGVNYSANLKHIRTSPDHGVAYEIAGKNMADENSFRQAIYTAIDIYNQRNEYHELTENPLRIADTSKWQKEK